VAGFAHEVQKRRAEIGGARWLAADAGQLAGHAVVLPTHELAHLPESRWLAARKGISVAFESNSMLALVEAARAGVGILPLVSMWGRRDPALVRLFDVPTLAPRSLWLVSSAEAARRPPVRAVADHVARIVGGDDPRGS
jgi:DNA-binding transcriptional LysR family regulator